MVMQLLNMQLNKVISMYNIQDTVDSLKDELKFYKDSINDLHERLNNKLSKKQSLVNSFESPAD
jgi:hypothetical protein